MRKLTFAVMLTSLAVLAGCAGDDTTSLAEKISLTQYAGQIAPVEHSRDGDVTTYTFDQAQGPMCMRGDDYLVGVRDTGSDDLVIFLQGGGACWSVFCLAVTRATQGVPTAIDLLNPELPGNPVANWNVVYLPYCDGSFFLGDSQHDDNINDKGTRYHHGLANLTAALEVALMRFPAPDRILLAGSSGGAYGLLFAGPLVRHYYPEAELILMADSGLGLARDGDAAYTQVLLDEFNLNRFLPANCPTCFSNGNLTGLFGYFLAHDKHVRIGAYTSWFDGVLATVFLQIPGDRYADAITSQTGALHDAYPDRFRRFVTDGNQHTALLGDPSGIVGTDYGAVELPPDSMAALIDNVNIGGMDTTAIGQTTMTTWLRGLIEGDLDAWTDILEERGTAPDTQE